MYVHALPYVIHDCVHKHFGCKYGYFFSLRNHWYPFGSSLLDQTSHCSLNPVTQRRFLVPPSSLQCRTAVSSSTQPASLQSSHCKMSAEVRVISKYFHCTLIYTKFIIFSFIIPGYNIWSFPFHHIFLDAFFLKSNTIFIFILNSSQFFGTIYSWIMPWLIFYFLYFISSYYIFYFRMMLKSFFHLNFEYFSKFQTNIFFLKSLRL